MELILFVMEEQDGCGLIINETAIPALSCDPAESSSLGERELVSTAGPTPKT